MNILITGGTGTVGTEMVRQFSKDNNITVFSRNEVHQVEMSRLFPWVKYVIGDIRSYKALKIATKGVDVIYHLAAIKHVPVCQNQPNEAIKTNVIGTMNVMKAAKRNGCAVVFLSTDKAESPSCVYGNTKAIAEHVVLDAGGIVVRSGNIFGSSGSVIPLFIEQVRAQNELTLTDGEMTRYFISPSRLVQFMFGTSETGKVYYPPMKAFSMRMVAEECVKRYGDADTKIKYIGARHGEKKHEVSQGVSSEYVSPIEYLEELFDIYTRV